MIGRRSFLRLLGLAPLAATLKPALSEPEMLEFRFNEIKEYKFDPIPKVWIDDLHSRMVDPPIIVLRDGRRIRKA